MSTPISDASDVEKGIVGPNPATAAASMTAAEGDDAETVVVTDPRKACMVNIAVVVLSGVAILIFALIANSLFRAGGSLGEAIGCTALAFLMCAAAVGTALYLRKDFISILSEAPRPDAASNLPLASQKRVSQV